MNDCKPIDILIAKNENLSKEMYPKTQKETKKMVCVPYANVVGSLMYAIMCTQPDICHTVGFVSIFQYNPELIYWKVVKRILKYHKRTANYVLCY